MTCDVVLTRLLEVEASELAGEGTSGIATHVRECTKCGSVARALLGDTRALAAALQPSGVPNVTPLSVRTRPSRRLVVGAGVASLAASILVGIFIQWGISARVDLGPPPQGVLRGPGELATTERPGGLINGQPTLPLERFGQPDAMRSAADKPLPLPAQVVAKPIIVEPIRTAELARVSLPAARVDVPAVSNEVLVNVSPPRGKRARVMRATTPGVTVVWMY